MRRFILYTLTLIPALFLQSNLFSQEKGFSTGYKIEGRDTIYYMNLSEVYLFSWDNKRKKDKEWREFYRLVYNFRKTYPYALIAKEKINEADSALTSQRLSKRDRERFIQQFELELFHEFEKPLRKMTFSQGKLLLKLIDREIGQSSYYIIKNYRGGAAAGFWQGIAKIFGS
ncbi:MAG: DUF4294 domain-containing protein, partial [Bacteroidales bacterium]|nr:DUF4294 domain-containing protein [Bacteroidales bacterium]